MKVVFDKSSTRRQTLMKPSMEYVLFPRGVPEKNENLSAYEKAAGYESLRSAVTKSSPQQIEDEVTRAGLRGRGGAGFPTGKKWSLARQVDAWPKYVVCNAGEDEPGSIKDGLLLQKRPHLVLEGIVLASYAIGATQAYLYVNVNYEEVYNLLEDAIAEAKHEGYLGNDILRSKFSLDLLLVKAPTNYVAGEDTAALEVIEGRPPLPRQKPPYPTNHGLFGKPTVVNNVETLANVPMIIARGADWFRSIGTQESPGTMIFSLGSELKKPGAYELPFGTSLRQLIYGCGGGLKEEKKIRALLPGGPSTAFLKSEAIDTPLDPKSFAEVGSTLGCGVMRVFPEGTCMVEEVAQIANFFAKECCGQCPACKMETGTLVALLEAVQKRQGNASIIDQFSKVINFNKGKGYCSLINMPAPPLQSALKLFPQDFEHHLKHGCCP